MPALAERTPQLPGSDAAEEGAYGLSNSRALEVFGQDSVFRPMEETVVELAKQLLEVEKGEEGEEKEKEKDQFPIELFMRGIHYK